MDDDPAVLSDRLLIIGEDYGNFPVHEPRWALTGKSGKRLADMGGISMRRFLRRTDRINVVNSPDDWGSSSAVSTGSSIAKLEMHRHENTLLLGRRVAVAMGFRNQDLFVWYMDATTRTAVAVLPHPSGRNRMLNDLGVVERYSNFLRAAFSNE